MPALFGYVFAILVLLGGGYAGLQWLAEPLPVTSHSPVAGGKASSKAKTLAQTSEPPYTGSEDRPSSEPKPTPTSATSTPPTQAAANSQLADDPPSQNTGAITPTNPAKDIGDIPRGGCMPFGVTGKGELVFPMECKAILTQNEDSQTPRQANSTVSVPAATQSAAPRQTETAANTDIASSNPVPTQNAVTRTEPDTNAKIGDARAGLGLGTTPDGQRSEADAGRTAKVTKRPSRPARPKGVMMVLRTIEFPDGHREQRLISMDHWRRTALRSEQW